MNLIEKLGGYKKAKEIHHENLVDFSGDATGVTVVMNDGLEFSHEQLCEAIADHERTDYVSDIRNHLSPTTVVIDK